MPFRQKTDFDNRPVGIFDSGLGGLTVVSAIRNYLPEENLVYLGDTARVPYGNRSAETVVEFALQDLHFLMEKNVKAVVIACNTVSAVAVDRMRQCCPEIPISGVIVPGVQAVLRTGSKKITVLGTRGTIRSGAYEKAILESCPDQQVTSISCPLLVPLAEEGIFDGPLLQQVLDLYLEDLKKDEPDILMLGCTHYPLFRGALQRYLPRTRIIDSAEVCAEMLSSLLDQYHLRATPGTPGTADFYVTDYSMEFGHQARNFLRNQVCHFEKVQLDL